MHVRNLERQRRVVAWAEEHLPVDEIASGPERHLFPAEHRELDASLTFIVQEMRQGELYSERLVAAALLAPVISTRNHALNALEVQPCERRGALAEEALHRLRREEPEEQVRERVMALLAR